jgi:adenosylcobinamide-GDP ribazoletransferase
MGTPEAVSGFGLAVTLLTRVPLRRLTADSQQLAGAVPWFPVVGALVGAAIAGVYAVASLGLPALAAATVAIGCGVLLTGALHEDGLGDSADALAGGWTREERLRILRDPRLGTYGVSAVVISLLLRVSALSALDPWDAAAALVAAHALARAVVTGLLGVLRPATEEGLGASYARAVTRGRVLGGVLVGAALGSAAVGVLALPASAVAVAGAACLGVAARRRLGGLTGDVLGAAEQLAEALVLLVAVVAATTGWTMVAWWR